MYEPAKAPGLSTMDKVGAGTNDKELEILTQVYQAQEKKAASSQRSIAQAAGMSVGMTNAILKRLAEKGFVMMRRVNSRNVHYLVTPAGVDEVAKRSYRYLRRTVGHVVRYKEHVREFCRTQRAAGRSHIVLIGPSDLSFLVEWCAEKEGLGFETAVRLEAALHGAATQQPQQQKQQQQKQQRPVYLLSENTTPNPVHGNPQPEPHLAPEAATKAPVYLLCDILAKDQAARHGR